MKSAEGLLYLKTSGANACTRRCKRTKGGDLTELNLN